MSYLWQQLEASILFSRASNLRAHSLRLEYQARKMESYPPRSGNGCMQCKSFVGCACWMALYGTADDRSLYADLLHASKVISNRGRQLQLKGHRIMKEINEARQFVVMNEFRTHHQEVQQ